MKDGICFIATPDKGAEACQIVCSDDGCKGAKGTDDDCWIDGEECTMNEKSDDDAASPDWNCTGKGDDANNYCMEQNSAKDGESAPWMDKDGNAATLVCKER